MQLFPPSQKIIITKYVIVCFCFFLLFFFSFLLLLLKTISVCMCDVILSVLLYRLRFPCNSRLIVHCMGDFLWVRSLDQWQWKLAVRFYSGWCIMRLRVGILARKNWAKFIVWIRCSSFKKHLSVAFTNYLNPLSTNPTKLSKILKQLVNKTWQIVWMCSIILWGWYLKGSFRLENVC